MQYTHSGGIEELHIFQIFKDLCVQVKSGECLDVSFGITLRSILSKEGVSDFELLISALRKSDLCQTDLSDETSPPMGF